MDEFIAVSDPSSAQAQDQSHPAVGLKKEYFDGGNPPLLQGKVSCLISRKPSLRTDFSYRMADDRHAAMFSRARSFGPE
jgi:ornithine carbamoyltransferase